MAFEQFLNDLCDIYHVQKDTGSPGYGLNKQPTFSYPAEPDVPGVACHFGVKSESTSINQTAPVNVKESRIKLTLPTGTDVRLNDKIIDKKNGYEYIAEIPHDVHGHHILSMSPQRASRGICDGDRQRGRFRISRLFSEDGQSRIRGF